jgi:hypothetical protein
MARGASRRAFDACAETCSDVDAIMIDAIKQIKSQATEPLRSALIEAYELIIDLESKVEEQEERIRDLATELERERKINETTDST